MDILSFARSFAFVLKWTPAQSLEAIDSRYSNRSGVIVENERATLRKAGC
ncbi:MAG TPA: hypothetical protein VGV41_11190 [Pseudolabrys sp.]|jgi:hypothetical protein|nr:hypothetical protein [Pseudolabrys sp.]HEV2629200.1 hypothetical protein [Pseudolabrys sp.]